MKIVLALCFIAFVGCGQKSEDAQVPAAVPAPIAKPTVEYPASVTANDKVHLSVSYMSAKNKLYGTVEKDFMIGSYFVKGKSEAIPVAFMHEDEEILLNLSVTAQKEVIPNVEYNEWLQMNAGKSYNM